MKTNILFPSISRNATGGHKVVYEYANRMAEDGYDVVIYYLPNELFTRYKIPEFLRVPMTKAYGDLIGPRTWFPLNKKIKTKVIDKADKMRSADVTMATAVETSVPVYHLGKEYGKKLYFIQDFENWNASDQYVFDSYRLGMKNLVVSNWLKIIVDQYSVSESILIPDGIDTSIFFENKEQVRKKHSIVFQYRKNPIKGGEYALETVELLHNKYPDLTVSIISTERDKPQLPAYCNYCFSLTPVQVAEVNNRSEVFICSTIDEGFGLPGLEAMACGCAVCSTDYTGVHEYVVDGYNALLSPIRDPQAMADNVSRLFDDDELRNQIVANGIKTGKEKSVDNSYKKFKSVLEETIKE